MIEELKWGRINKIIHSTLMMPQAPACQVIEYVLYFANMRGCYSEHVMALQDQDHTEKLVACERFQL